MAVPKRKISKSRKRNRQSGKAYDLPRTVLCPHCRRPRPPHRICPHCGYYKGRAAAEVKEG
ncbi:MAG: 50S ribosomal protein L32 [PVC group bacterium]